MNRAERRKNPDQWWELRAIADGNSKPLPVGDHTVNIQGRIGDLVVVSVPHAMAGAMEGLMRMLNDAGIENAVIVPEGVRFLSARPVSPEKSKELDRNHRQAEQQRARQRQQKEGMH